MIFGSQHDISRVTQSILIESICDIYKRKKIVNVQRNICCFQGEYNDRGFISEVIHLWDASVGDKAA